MENVKLQSRTLLGGLGVFGHSRVAEQGRYGPLSGVRARPNRQTLSKRITVGGDTTRVTDDRGGDRSRFGHTHASVGYGGLAFEF